MIILLVLGLIVRRCLKDSKEMCGELESIVFCVFSVFEFFLIFYFSD